MLSSLQLLNERIKSELTRIYDDSILPEFKANVAYNLEGFDSMISDSRNAFTGLNLVKLMQKSLDMLQEYPLTEFNQFMELTQQSRDLASSRKSHIQELVRSINGYLALYETIESELLVGIQEEPADSINSDVLKKTELGEEFQKFLADESTLTNDSLHYLLYFVKTSLETYQQCKKLFNDNLASLKTLIGNFDQQIKIARQIATGKQLPNLPQLRQNSISQEAYKKLLSERHKPIPILTPSAKQNSLTQSRPVLVKVKTQKVSRSWESMIKNSLPLLAEAIKPYKLFYRFATEVISSIEVEEKAVSNLFSSHQLIHVLLTVDTIKPHDGTVKPSFDHKDYLLAKICKDNISLGQVITNVNLILKYRADLDQLLQMLNQKEQFEILCKEVNSITNYAEANIDVNFESWLSEVKPIIEIGLYYANQIDRTSQDRHIAFALLNHFIAETYYFKFHGHLDDESYAKKAAEHFDLAIINFKRMPFDRVSDALISLYKQYVDLLEIQDKWQEAIEKYVCIEKLLINCDSAETQLIECYSGLAFCCNRDGDAARQSGHFSKARNCYQEAVNNCTAVLSLQNSLGVEDDNIKKWESRLSSLQAKCGELDKVREGVGVDSVQSTSTMSLRLLR